VSPPGVLCPIGGDSLEGPHSFRSKVTWPELQRINIRRTRSVDLDLVDISQLTVVVSGPKFTKFFCSMWERLFCAISFCKLCFIVNLS